MTGVSWLEHRIPPPVVGATLATGMWFLAPVGPTIAMPDIVRYGVAGLLLLVALAFSLLGVRAFRVSRTTVNPLKPDQASALVTGGVYRVTRNPMYVGMAFVLLGWAVFLSAAWPFLGPLLFVLYITRFQIQPEERALARLFDGQFARYRARVRRWL